MMLVHYSTAPISAWSGLQRQQTLLFFCFSPWLICLFIVKHAVLATDFQDCAGVILCAAERATQVALQVNKLCLHRL